MKLVHAILIFSLFSLISANAQDTGLSQYIRYKSIIKDGGTELFSYEDQKYIISVVSVVVGSKNELDCKKVAAAKAKKEILSYINGSEISSYTELRVIENTDNSIEGAKMQTSQEYTEVIREKVLGVINQCSQLSGWYSEDKSVYYYALYKSIQ